MPVSHYAHNCPEPESLVVLGVVPRCRTEDIDPAVLAFLADCALEEESPFVLRAMACARARELLEEVRDGRR